MKKGFIEQILDDKVLIIYEDGSKETIDIHLLPRDIKIDMQVEKTEEGYKITKKDEILEEEIKEVTEKLFKPFNPKNIKKRQR